MIGQRFTSTLEQRKGKAEGISDTLVDMMMKITQDLEKTKTPYPDASQKLYDMLNQQAETFGQ